jgi:hypothetical protein
VLTLSFKVDECTPLGGDDCGGGGGDGAGGGGGGSGDGFDDVDGDDGYGLQNLAGSVTAMEM